MSTKQKFTPEEIKNLKANPYTLRVTEDSISDKCMSIICIVKFFDLNFIILEQLKPINIEI